MLLEELLERERQISEAEGRTKGKAEGKAESILFFLARKGFLSEELSNYIMNETNLQILDHWLELAVSADSIEQFIDKVHFII